MSVIKKRKKSFSLPNLFGQDLFLEDIEDSSYTPGISTDYDLLHEPYTPSDNINTGVQCEQQRACGCEMYDLFNKHLSKVSYGKRFKQKDIKRYQSFSDFMKELK